VKKSSNIKSIHVNEEISKKSPSAALELKNINLEDVIRQGLQDFMFEIGMMAVQQTMAAEVETLAGPRYARNTGYDADRWGSQQGMIYVNGQKVNIKKPRVVSKKVAGKRSEVELQTYSEFSKPTAMDEAIMAKVLAGVSTRDYAGTIDQVVEGHGVSKSAVSRRSVKEAAKQLGEFYNRRFTEQEFVVIMMDGIGIAEVDNIVALGIDVWGKKHVLGLRQGATENTQVCLELLEDLVDRGIKADGDYLFVVDGGKALSKSIKKVFGQNAVIQRCQVHKRRNVSDKLPKEHQTRIDNRLAAAYAMNELHDARKAVEAVFDELVDLNESAAGSLEEGMEETMTVHKLGIKGDLKRILSSTNSIESMFSMSRRYKRNVKKWNKKTDHIERTLVVTLLEAERRFKRVRGYRELKDLQTKIKNLRATTCNTKAA
jgi:transposase-like protein